MNKSAFSTAAEDVRGASAARVTDEIPGASRLRLVDSEIARIAPGRTRSFVSISVGADGNIAFESEVEPQHADQVTDVLLLMLLKAREARKRG